MSALTIYISKIDNNWVYDEVEENASTKRRGVGT